MKKVFKGILWFILAILIAVILFFGWLTIREYKPAPVDPLVISGTASAPSPKAGDTLDIVSWNIGYAGLGHNEDFFMDGGKMARPNDKETVNTYLDGIKKTVYGDNSFDIVMLQEVDTKSHRTYSINEVEYLAQYNWSHALNYSCDFVPIPIPPMGMIHSGIFTDSSFPVERADRIALPCPFSWPVSTANLKRCLMASYIPLEGTDAELVIVNLHLEAYDSGEGKIAQTNQLREFIQNEYAKGNYVIAGGDFNQIFPGGLDKYPNTHAELWLPGLLENDILPDGWQFAYDLETPTCRLLNQPYDPSDTFNTQYYVIDGFILSPNLTLEGVETMDVGFVNSDHNPVHLTVTLS